MEQPEARFKRNVVEAFEALHPRGWSAYMRALGKNGVPDLRFVIPGVGGLWVEAKAEEKPYSPIQRLQMTQMRAAGDRTVGLRCRGMEGKIPGRSVSIEIPDGAAFKTVFEGKWSILREDRFWTYLFTYGAMS